MRFKLGCSLSYTAQNDMPFLFNVEAQRFGAQTIEHESLTTTPEAGLDTWVMPESGNRYVRALAPAGKFTLNYEATVDLHYTLEDPVLVTELMPSTLPLSVFPHLYPSRYCQSDKLERFANTTFGHCSPGYFRVAEICNWIHGYVAYEGGVSDAMTSAFDTVTQRAGVCRDFAHLAVALCRTMAIPARYVSAYAFRLQPPDFHAVFEAFLLGPNGPGWYIFDATRMADPSGLVRIGVGRDAADVAFASPYGSCQYDAPKVWIESVDPAPEATVQAVLTEPFTG